LQPAYGAQTNPYRHRWPWGFCFGFQQNTPGAGQGWRC
jgi:hypothetical protein